ncbi:hypothetical protein Goklo_017313 [Gossypium klotzschianum]|nr:hypothetical protein [Gossypium klotzschianum]
MWFRSSFGFMPDHISLINLDRLLRLGLSDSWKECFKFTDALLKNRSHYIKILDTLLHDMAYIILLLGKVGFGAAYSLLDLNKRILTQKHVPAFSQQNKMQTSYLKRSRIRFQKISAPSFVLCEE